MSASAGREMANPASWPAKDIAYVAIVGILMLAALIEWFLWLAAFLYCLTKVFKKAENASTRVLAILMIIIFTLLRATFLPVMLVTIPLPGNVTQKLLTEAVRILQWFAFWTFSGLLVIPWLLCIYQLIAHSIGRTPLIRHILDERAAPKIAVIMPCYKEYPAILLRTVDSIVGCDYPTACLHVFLSFDGDQEDDLYLNTLERLGVPMVRRSGFPTSIDVIYRDVRVTVSRFPHGGKRHCQKRTFRLMERIYERLLSKCDDVFVLFIDSDCVLDKVCLQNFMYEMVIKPDSKRPVIAMTGVVTATTSENTLLTLLQDVEYIHGQLFERAVESTCGAVTCLPGALTILRFSAFHKLAKLYFADKAERCDDLFDYGKCHLGEDRWLTHLFMVASKYGQIGISTGAFCKTEAVRTFKSLLKQRRRWFLGFITNEVCLLTDLRLWMRYPFLCLIRLAQDTIRTTTLLFFIMVLSLITTSQQVDDLPVGFIAVSLGLNWALMVFFAASLGRYKTMLYPLLFVIGPFFSWIYMVYAFFTAGQRTWGGPRADAGQADAVTSPQAAIEYAEATGDDLNIVPESFRPAMQARARDLASRRTLAFSKRIHERLTQSAPKVGAWRDAVEESIFPTKTVLSKSATAPHMPLHPRPSMSMESIASAMSEAPDKLRHEPSRDGVHDHGVLGYSQLGSRLHPPIARSAGYHTRRSRRDSNTTTSSEDSHHLGPTTPVAHNDANDHTPLQKSDSGSASAADRVAAWQSLTLPQISPFLSSEERLLILPEDLPQAPNHRSDDWEDIVIPTSGTPFDTPHLSPTLRSPGNSSTDGGETRRKKLQKRRPANPGKQG